MRTYLSQNTVFVFWLQITTAKTFARNETDRNKLNSLLINTTRVSSAIPQKIDFLIAFTLASCH